ncbi:hypothetical protein FIBSPDRAFT_963713 [Athelia psychrophila]|uniref:Uncharacterized protein n=1 Tax=Athelia psychrophila TaxID=1759441 RepID=A0A165YP41_9AGAM|nr:hypothetical protein FIBSPDRAFT_963713 [Fibularhizoctonia sp. CBS 109695]
MSSHFLYHPDITGARTGGVVACDAANRAKARHGIAFDLSQYQDPRARPSSEGLHTWDIFIRSTTPSDIRDRFIQDTQNDLHDAAAALDNITGGFTIILHSHGLPSNSSDTIFLPEDMKFTAYLTRRELPPDPRPQYAASIARIAQIFAGDLMPEHCRQYSSRCAKSGMPHDTFRHESALPSEDGLLALLPPPHPVTSQFTFRGLSPGVLENYLLMYRDTAAPSHGPLSLIFPVAHPTYLDIESSVVPASSFNNPPLPHARGKISTKERSTKDEAAGKVSSGKLRRQARGQRPAAADFFKSMTIIKSPLRFEDSVAPAPIDTSLGRSSST